MLDLQAIRLQFNTAMSNDSVIQLMEVAHKIPDLLDDIEQKNEAVKVFRRKCEQYADENTSLHKEIERLRDELETIHRESEASDTTAITFFARRALAGDTP
jgi:regulator of replication initiation timing